MPVGQVLINICIWVLSSLLARERFYEKKKRKKKQTQIAKKE